MRNTANAIITGLMKAQQNTVGTMSRESTIDNLW